MSEHLLNQNTGMSENVAISDCTANTTELDNGIQGLGLSDHLLPIKTRFYANKNNSPKANARFETVNNRIENFSMEGQLKFVHSDREGLPMGNHIED